MKSYGHYFFRLVLLCFLVLTGFEVLSAELTASVNGQKYGTIEVFKVVFARDSMFKDQVEIFYFSDPSHFFGAVDFPYRPHWGGAPSAHMGCSQTSEYPGGPAKITFNCPDFERGSTLWVRIVYSKNSPATDSFRLFYNSALMISFVPRNWGSWDDYHSADFRFRIL
jgi:hypothetical protein